MNISDALTALEQEWDREHGFLGQLRDGVYNPSKLENLLDILHSVNLGNAPTINRRFVSLTWYIPLFMTWQRERVQEKAGDFENFENAINQVTNTIEDLLGIP